jgi:LuxR family transcriptional regulator, maltose regulon positive regulatory protein
VLLGHTAMACVKEAWGDGPGAIAAIEAFMTFARRRGIVPPVLAQAVAELARVRLRQGDLPAATRWMEGSGLSADGEVRYPQEVEYLTLVRILIAQGRAAEAMPLLSRLLDAAEAGTRMGSVIEILILRALALHAQKQTASALIDLSRALALAEPEAYVRIFADEGQPMAALLEQAAVRGLTPAYAMKLLAATRTKRHRGDHVELGSPVGMSALVEPLTEREHEVLRLVAAGASNAEISRKLVVAVSTVHTHVHNILAKMNVRRRTQAIARAKELGLL